MMPSTPRASSGTPRFPTTAYGSGTWRNAAFEGRHKKIWFAELAIGATRWRHRARPVDEVVWWPTDDFWWFAVAASVAGVRTCSERRGEPVPTFVARLKKGLTGPSSSRPKGAPKRSSVPGPWLDYRHLGAASPGVDRAFCSPLRCGPAAQRSYWKPSIRHARRLRPRVRNRAIWRDDGSGGARGSRGTHDSRLFHAARRRRRRRGSEGAALQGCSRLHSKTLRHGLRSMLGSAPVTSKTPLSAIERRRTRLAAARSGPSAW